MKIPGILTQVRFTLNLAVALSLVGVCVVTAFILFSSIRQFLIFGMAVGGGIATIYSAYYIGQALHQQIYRDKLHRTFELITQFTDTDFSKVRHFIEISLDHDNTPPAEIFNKIKDDSDLYSAVKTALNWFELVATAVRTGHVDEKTSYYLIYYSMDYYFQCLKPYTLEERKQSEDADIYIEAENLLKSWNSGKYLINGKEIEKRNIA